MPTRQMVGKELAEVPGVIVVSDRFRISEGLRAGMGDVNSRVITLEPPDPLNSQRRGRRDLLTRKFDLISISQRK